jgi:hypothetical protein
LFDNFFFLSQTLFRNKNNIFADSGAWLVEGRYEILCFLDCGLFELIWCYYPLNFRSWFMWIWGVWSIGGSYIDNFWLGLEGCYEVFFDGILKFYGF